MTLTLLIAMFMFSLAMSISPGPINMVIVSTGANYGFRRTVPFVSGATIGFTILLLFVGLGFLQVFKAFPSFLTYLAVFGSAFTVYMGYKIATAAPSLSIDSQNIPKFSQGFLLQWLNPKAWIACVSGASLFSVAGTHRPFLTFVFIYFLVCYASLAIWGVLGDKATLLLNSRRRIRAFNVSMGGLLIASALYLLYVQLFEKAAA